MPLYGPNAVEVEETAEFVRYQCPVKSCGRTTLYLVQGPSGALPPRCHENAKTLVYHQGGARRMDETARWGAWTPE